MNLKGTFSNIRHLLKIGSSEGIAKRYFVMNAFDGALTALGLIIGSWIAGISEPKTLIIAGLGASIAMGVSGGFGAYLTETAVKKEELVEYEKAMLKDFENTIFDDAALVTSYFVAFVDGISPFIASILCFSPFIFAQIFHWKIEFAFMSAIVVSACVLFVLGGYLGKISQENMIKSGMKMLLAGLITGILVLFLEFL